MISLVRLHCAPHGADIDVGQVLVYKVVPLMLRVYMEAQI